MPPRETNHTLGFSDQKSDPCDRQSGVDHPVRGRDAALALLSQFVSADTLETMAKPKEAMALDWHVQFRGVYTRIAKQLEVHPSYVSRVARGERRSEKIEQALKAEIAQIEKRRPT